MEKVGIKVKMLDDKLHFIELDDIIFIQVDKKVCSFYLKNETPEATIKLIEVWEMINKAAMGHEHHLMKVGRDYIINMDYYVKNDPSRNIVILRRDSYTTTASEIVKKNKREIPKDLMAHVQAIKELQGNSDSDKRKDSDIVEVPMKYFEVPVGETPMKRLLKKKEKWFGVLDNYAIQKELTVSIKDLNDEHHLEAGHEYVDLGLPNGTLWSTHNLGEYDKDTHSYYGWGELYESDSYDIDHYDAQGVGSLKQIGLPNDVARKNWGGNWRIPSYYDFDELIENCEISWCSKPQGCLLTSKINGSKIFLPAYGLKRGHGRNELMKLQGSYWTSSAMYKDCGTAFLFTENDFREGGLGIHPNSKIERFSGLSIRPVLSKPSENGLAEKKTVMLIRSYRFYHDTPFCLYIWTPEGWNVERPWLLANPKEAMDYYRDYCDKVKPDLIVSFGSASFFCKQLEGYPRIFLNPNYLPSDDLIERKEFIKKSGISQELINAYQEVEKTSLLVKGDEKCCVVYGEPDEDEIYPTWDDPDLNSLETIKVAPWKSPYNWMNTFLYPLIDKMVK
jgi:hypothetical protein